MENTSLRRTEHACADLPCSAFLLPRLGSAHPLCQPGTRGGVSRSHRRRGDTHPEPGPVRGQRAGSQTRLPGADGVTSEGCETILAGGSARREYRPSHTYGHSSAHTYIHPHVHLHSTQPCTLTSTMQPYAHIQAPVNCRPCCSALRGASTAAPEEPHFWCQPLDAARQSAPRTLAGGLQAGPQLCRGPAGP